MRKLLFLLEKSILMFSITEKKQVKKSSFSITTNMLKCLFVVLSLNPFADLKAQSNNSFDMVNMYGIETTTGYSLRKLSSTYFGSAIEVRRSGDNALKDIGFIFSPDWGVFRDLDTPSLIAFTDAGNVWNTGVLISGTPQLYYNKQLANGDLLVVSYITNRIHRSTNNGVNWTTGVVVAAGAGLRGITQLANGDVLATGYLDNKVYRSIDNGSSWNAGTLVAAGAGLSGITQLSNGVVLTVGTTTNRVYRSTDNGATWDAGVLVAAGAGLSGITQLSNGNLLVTGNTSNKIYRSTDFGATWDAGTTITGASVTGITQLASGHVVAVDNAANKIYRSLDNGVTWSAGSLVATSAGIVGISQLANGEVVASATNGRIYKSIKLNAFVRTWYDQSGRNLRAVQSVLAQQPRIVNAGVIEQVNGKPAVYFNGLNNLRCFTPTPFPTTGFSGFTANVVAKWTTTGTTASSSQTLIDNNFNGTTQGFVIRDRPDLAAKPASFGITVSPGTLSTVSDNTQTGNGTARMLTFGADNTTVSGFKEGTAMPTSLITGTNYNLQTTMVIGARWNGGTVNNRLTGHISEIIILPVAPSCNTRYLEEDQSQYYSITYDYSTQASAELNNQQPDYTCVNTPYTRNYATTGVNGISTSATTYLPPGLTASWSNNVLTISGTPTQVNYHSIGIPLNIINPTPCSGTFMYASGSLYMTNSSLNTSPSSNPTVCANTVMPQIMFNLYLKEFTMGTPVNLPPGVSTGDPGYGQGSIYITGTPTLAGTYNYTIPLTNVTCVGNVTLSGTITVTNTQINSVGPASSTPTLCVGSFLPTITHTTTGGTGIGPASGLPPGVTATFANNLIRISGTPTVANVYNYSIPLLGACGSSAATGTITVTTSGTANTVGPPSSSPTICIGQALPTITHATTGVNGIGTPTGLPGGINATWAGNVITISGTPTMNGTFNYSIPLIGGCGNVSATGTITVNATQPYITSSLPVTAVGTVSTFAGNSSYSNVNGTGTAASFRRPEGAVADALGNIYVVDASNHNIRKITPAAVVTTFAGKEGTGSAWGYVDATGTAARFNNPIDIAIDRFGNLFVADAGNNLIRKITPQGVVSTYAGVRNVYGNQNGPALQATFSYIYSITVDPAGNVYAGDYDYNLGGAIIRKITPEGIVSTFAGSGNWGYQDGPGAQANFSDVGAMCADAAGNLYVTDYVYVRKVTPSGFVSTVAGNGIEGSTNAPDALQASFSYLTGIVVDAVGNLYVIESGVSRHIRRITPTGVVSTLAGSSTSGYVDGVGNAARFDFQSSSGLCIDYSGNLFAMDNRRIRKIVVAETVGVCSGDAVTLTANGGTSYSWSGPQAITNGVPFTVAAGGTHTVTATNGSCSSATRAITLDINQPTITTSNPSLCVNTILIITRTTTVATSIGIPTGLPPGVTATWASNVLTISGIPSLAGVYNYSIPLLGACPFNATGTITVNDNSVSAPSSTPSLCINTPLTAITHTTTGATGIGLAVDLPSGVTASWAGNTITISGTPTEEGIFEYSIPLTGGCGNDNAVGTITVGANTADNSAGSAANSPTICISDGLSNITFNTTGATGIINSGISGANGLPPGVSATWAANVITISGTPTTTGTFPYSIPLTGGCGSVFATGTITIFPSPVGGSIDGSATVCSGTNTTNLTLSGHTGTITRWESTLTNFATAGTPIANTSTSLTVSNLTATTSYRAVITSGSCVTYSATATVTVSPASVGGTATATPDTLCSGNSTTITLTGNTGSTIQWQQSADGSTGWATVTGGSGGTTATYTTPNLTATTYYRAVVTSGACVAAYSTTAPVTVTAFPASVGGTITGSASVVCSGTNSTILTLGGHIGTVTRWESSLNNFTTAGTTINNTATTLTATNLTATTSYRAVVTNGACAATNSAPATVTVSPASVGGTATATPPSLCSGNFTTITLTGNTGSTIQWQQSPNGTTGWATVTGGSGGTTATYTTPNLTATTYYRAVVTSGACAAANSAIALVSVTAFPASVGGTITGSASVCSGTNSTILTLGGHTGTVTRWESSLDNFTTAGTTINNTSTTLTATNLTATTSYRAVVTNGACSAANSATATVTVSQVSNTVGVPSSTPSVIVNTVLTNIIHTTTGASGIGAALGLPNGVSAAWLNNFITISGTPTAEGIFNYSIPLVGGCGAVNATGTIRVTKDIDGDGVGDTADVDNDNDGVIDTLECGFCINGPFANGSFETPVIAASSSSMVLTANVTGWSNNVESVIEIWSTGYNGVTADVGNQFVKLNAGSIYRTFCSNGLGGNINWTIKHRGRAGVDVAEVKFGATLATLSTVATLSDNNSAWGNYSGTYTIPGGQTTIVLAITPISSTGGLNFGNFIDDIQIIITQNCIDSDGDSVADNLDVDDENDGIPDIEEIGFKAYSNGKSTMDRSSSATWADANTNGINDFVDTMITGGAYLIPDTDGDGVPNYKDFDSDNDAIFDVDEANLLNGDGDINGDGKGDGLDTDADGLLNLYDNSASYGTTARAYAQDTDADGTPDYMELDSNNDGVKDIAGTLYSALDTNNDGKIDGTVDADNDGLLDTFDTNTAVKGSPRDLNRKLLIDFDGRNDYGLDTTALPALTNETLMAWIDLNSGFSSTGVIVGQPGFQLRVNSSRNLEAIVNGSTITFSTPVGPYTTAALNTSQWYHVGAVYDGSTVNLYLNGIKVASGSANGSVPAAALTLGKNPSAASNYFKGKIDEVRIFNVALTDSQFQRMVYQEVQNTESQVRGTIAPKNIEALPYTNLLRNYRMDGYKDDIVDDVTTTSMDTGTGMKLYNQKVIAVQQAPMPFTTIRSGTFATAIDDPTNDIRGLDATQLDYSIIQVNHNITETANNTDLAMFVNSGATVKMTNDTKLQNDWYIKLDGKIDLVGKSQLIQTANSELDVTSTGSLERDQQGQPNKFNFNFWSSPVSIINNTAINNGFTVAGVMKDGTDPNNIQDLNWTEDMDGSPTTPITLSSNWIFKFQNTSNNSANWISVGQNGDLSPGQGFTLKGSGSAEADQNYTFVGKPNNGTITSTVGANNLNLSGNPYPSAIDADKFIDDNTASLIGTLHMWQHYSTNNSHNTAQYQGGYATYTKIGGTPPVAPVGSSGLGSSSKTPKRFIPIGQGFFVTGSSTGGNITFNNSQRLFIKEDSNNSYTMFRTANPTVANSTSTMNNAEDTFTQEQFMKVRLGFNSADLYHRQILLGFMNQYGTTGFDSGYDALSIETPTNDMYFINGTDHLNINGEGYYNADNIYPLGVVNQIDGNVKFILVGIENFDANQEIYIYDNVTNTYNSIISQPYEVNLPAGTYDNRFSLTFKTQALGTIDNEENYGITVTHTQANNMINIKNELQDATVKSVLLFNLLGQKITEWPIGNQDQTAIHLPISVLPTATYIVKVITDKGNITKKIVIK